MSICVFLEGGFSYLFLLLITGLISFITILPLTPLVLTQYPACKTSAKGIKININQQIEGRKF